MRRIVVALASTVTALVLLFSYHTSLNRTGTTAVVAAGTGLTQSQGLGTGTTSSGASGSSGATGSSGASGASGGGGSSGGTSTGTGQTYTGQSAQTRYGPVQVQITVVDGAITDATAVDYPNGNGRDQMINSRAVPLLEDETLQAQSAEVDVVSGATYTSDGYARSLQSAIDEAGL